MCIKTEVYKTFKGKEEKYRRRCENSTKKEKAYKITIHSLIFQ